MYVLDTDQLTLLNRGHAQVIAHVKALPAADLATTIITVEEQLRGWFTQVRQSRDRDKLALAYKGLFEVIALAQTYALLPFSPAAIDRYMAMRKALPRLGRQDLAIAAIVLEHNATLVTRNRSDFIQIPGLRIEDWARP